MISRNPGTRDPFVLWLRRLTPGAAVGYLVFVSGTLLCIWPLLTWKTQSDENPFVVLLLVWLIAGTTHIVIKAFWRACVISAFGSVLGYIVLAVVFLPNPFNNEMFGAGMIEVGLFGFVLAMVMGVPVVIYRRIRHAGTQERSDPG